ncbi:hypothetical protein E7744_02155 [Citricoccus sp. SGAir0253]|uniref:hypothetical protein n=1 Tax=Citricoccus sp. SGAir0253 TaxID=2567881 RepID=UPI0010CCB512|nr:hypothetical protein [Citricoccus sp. SGAir0253]QCU77152.1 hypothetical protein E7744_02155 [Citricoccus sp. SGAir0253]
MTHSVWPLSLQPLVAWAYAFSTSAGLGGVAALFAAVIAYRGVTRSAETARRTALESAETARNTSLEAQWWENARWAADRLLSASDVTADTDAPVGDARILDGDEATMDLLVDHDAYAAIIMLEYLGENAPSEKASSFALDALGAVLGLPSGGDTEDSQAEDNTGSDRSNRTTRGEADL